MAKWLTRQKVEKVLALTSRTHLITLLLIILFLILWFYFGPNSPGRQSPRRSRPADPHVEWAMTDHNNLNNPLPNNLTDTTAPSLEDTAIIRIPRDNTLNYTIPRFQGEIIYQIP